MSGGNHPSLQRLDLSYGPMAGQTQEAAQGVVVRSKPYASAHKPQSEEKLNLKEMGMGYGPMEVQKQAEPCRRSYMEAVKESRRREALQPGLRRPRSPSPGAATTARAKAEAGASQRAEGQESSQEVPAVLSSQVVPVERTRVWIPKRRCRVCKRRNFGFRASCPCSESAPPATLALQAQQVAMDAAVSLEERRLMLQAEAESLKAEWRLLEIDKQQALQEQELLRRDIQAHRARADPPKTAQAETTMSLALKRRLACKLFEAKKRLRSSTTTA